MLLKLTSRRRGPCFIATVAFAHEPHALELRILREFRDQKLRPYWVGRQLIWLYYRLSRPVALWLGERPAKRRVAHELLTKIAHFLKKNLN